MNWKQTNEYGLGRDVLPAHIARPLVAVSDRLGARPFMEYSQSYCVYNWKRRDPSAEITVDNLDLIRTQFGGPSERGFVAVHVAMVNESRHMVTHARKILDAVEKDDRQQFNQSLLAMRQAYDRAHDIFLTMWQESKPEDYNEFRTFIMGTKSQPMFPKGVRYLGVGDDSLERHYRGESGANDNMIPLSDNLLQLFESFPENPLTECLRDFRSYRPQHHRDYLEAVQMEAQRVGVRAYAEADTESLLCYAGLLDTNRAIRQTHWDMVKGYILNFSKHPRATGGTPIVSYLPNQLGQVLKVMDECLDKVQDLKASGKALSLDGDLLFKQLLDSSYKQTDRLRKEIDLLGKKFGRQAVES